MFCCPPSPDWMHTSTYVCVCVRVCMWMRECVFVHMCVHVWAYKYLSLKNKLQPSVSENISATDQFSPENLLPSKRPPRTFWGMPHTHTSESLQIHSLQTANEEEDSSVWKFSSTMSTGNTNNLGLNKMLCTNTRLRTTSDQLVSLQSTILHSKLYWFWAQDLLTRSPEGENKQKKSRNVVCSNACTPVPSVIQPNKAPTERTNNRPVFLSLTSSLEFIFHLKSIPETFCFFPLCTRQVFIPSVD